jgi:hypothetical protein
MPDYQTCQTIIYRHYHEVWIGKGWTVDHYQYSLAAIAYIGAAQLNHSCWP